MTGNEKRRSDIEQKSTAERKRGTLWFKGHALPSSVSITAVLSIHRTRRTRLGE